MLFFTLNGEHLNWMPEEGDIRVKGFEFSRVFGKCFI